MVKIKFNNKNIFEEVEFSRTEHTTTLKNLTEENTSGFCTYRLSGEQLGDFSDFTTIYDKGNDYIVFSNDCSVKQDPQPYEPTAEDKIRELKSKLAATDYQIIKCSECQLLGRTCPTMWQNSMNSGRPSGMRSTHWSKRRMNMTTYRKSFWGGVIPSDGSVGHYCKEVAVC